MLKKLLMCVVMLFSLFTLTGCWDNKDINHRVMPVVMGVSKEGDDLKVYLQIPHPLENKIQTEMSLRKEKQLMK